MSTAISMSAQAQNPAGSAQRIETDMFRHRMRPGPLVPERIGWLASSCVGKKVIDIGVVSPGNTGFQMERGVWLHGRLTEVSTGIIGVDVDRDGLAQLEREGVKNLVAADIAESPMPVVRAARELIGGCDTIVCAEVLEHLLDVGRFLAGLREIARSFGAEIIITVPNTFCLRRMIGVARGIEWVHPDHKYYYSWKTVTTLLEQAGFRVDSILFYADVYDGRLSSAPKRLAKRVLNSTVLRFFPQFGEGLIVVARPRD